LSPGSTSTGREHGTGERRKAWTWSFLLFVLALLSKTVTATLPAAMLVIAWWRRGRIARRDVAPTIPFFAAGAAAGILTSWMERFHVGASGGDWSLSIPERFRSRGGRSGSTSGSFCGRTR
jgi:hypothetical protein